MRAMVNLTGGYEKGLAEALSKYDRAYPGRFFTFTEPSYSFFKDPNYPKLQARRHRAGAQGWRAGIEDSKDARTLSAGEHHLGHTGED